MAYVLKNIAYVLKNITYVLKNIAYVFKKYSLWTQTNILCPYKSTPDQITHECDDVSLYFF